MPTESLPVLWVGTSRDLKPGRRRGAPWAEWVRLSKIRWTSPRCGTQDPGPGGRSQIRDFHAHYRKAHQDALPLELHFETGMPGAERAPS